MRKTFSFTLLLTGIFTIVYAAQYAVNSAWSQYVAVSFTEFTMPIDAVMDHLLYMTQILVAGLLMILAGGVFLWLLRKREGIRGGNQAVLVSMGVMLVAQPVVNAFCAAELHYYQAYKSPLVSIYSAEDYWSDALQYVTQYWMTAALGAVFLLVGIVGWIKMRRKEPQTQAVPEKAPEQPETEPEPKPEKAQFERRITLYCTVMDIRGDYALVKYDGTGVESEVAIALLPSGIDTGDRLKYENYEFTQA